MNEIHRPVKRIVPGAKNAVIFIHGIVATPRFFDGLVSQVPADWSVHSLLLPGHGGTVSDFGRTPGAEWAAHVHDAVAEMRQSHERIYLAGHSLGTLLAIREAVRDDEKIAGMLLLCVPLRIRVKPSALWRNTLKGLGLGKDGPDLHTYYGVAQDWRFWRYIRWIPRYLELFRESAAARREIPRLTVPAVALMARKDELVSPRSAKDLANPRIRVRELPNSMHHAFPPEDRAAVLAAMREVCCF